MDNVKEHNGKSKYAAYTLFATKDELSVIFQMTATKERKRSFDDADNVYAMHFCFISIGSVVLDVLWKPL